MAKLELWGHPSFKLREASRSAPAVIRASAYLSKSVACNILMKSALDFWGGGIQQDYSGKSPGCSMDLPMCHPKSSSVIRPAAV